MIVWKNKRCFYNIFSNNSCPTINRLPQIVAPLREIFKSSPSSIIAPQPLAILSAGTPITVNLEVEAEVESNPANDESSSDAEYIDIEDYLGTSFGTL